MALDFTVVLRSRSVMFRRFFDLTSEDRIEILPLEQFLAWLWEQGV